ncbi:MAG: TAXI family TRAP transporter solute-binding subunit [Thermomicrobiales bacterium]
MFHFASLSTTVCRRGAMASAAFLVAGAIAPAGDVLAQSKPDIRIATGRQGGAYYNMGAVIADMLVRSNLVNSATAETSSGAIESARLAAKGTAQIAAMDNTWVVKAIAGEKPFQEKIKLTTVAPLGSWPLFFVTLADSPIKTVDDLKGRRISVGARNSGMDNHARVLLQTLGLSYDDIKPMYLSFGPGGRAVKDGKAEAQLQCCLPNGGMTELSELSKVRAVSYGDKLDKITKAVSTYGVTTLKKGAFKGHDKDIPSISILQGWMATESLPEETAYIFAKIVIANLDQMAKKALQFASVKQLIEKAKAENSVKHLEMGAPLHPGALKAFKEAGILK